MVFKKAILISLLFVLPVVEAEFTAQINSGFDVIAGNSETLELTMTTDEKVKIHLSYDVKPDDVGFDVTFSENDFTFQGSKLIEVNISTSGMLSPDNYVISINYVYEKKGESSGSGTIVINDELDKPDENDDDEHSKSEDEQNETDKQNGTDNNSTDNEGRITDDDKEQNGFIYIIGFLVVLLLILILIWKRRKSKEEQ